MRSEQSQEERREEETIRKGKRPYKLGRDGRRGNGRGGGRRRAGWKLPAGVIITIEMPLGDERLELNCCFTSPLISSISSSLLLLFFFSANFFLNHLPTFLLIASSPHFAFSSFFPSSFLICVSSPLLFFFFFILLSASFTWASFLHLLLLCCISSHSARASSHHLAPPHPTLRLPRAGLDRSSPPAVSSTELNHDTKRLLWPQTLGHLTAARAR